ncbi:MAG: HAD-IA family hydrolase [bacterium]
MSKYLFDAFVFDLDGVITKTALVHSSAWKKMFEDFLKEREKKHGEPFKEFSHQEDYLPYVDGKPRYKGVASFLESRGINIPFGDPADTAGMETVCALGNRKDIAFREILETDGIGVYPSTITLIKELKSRGIKVGVASSSKNCKPVLEGAGLLDLFETRVDGVVSAELGLHGKPEPDIFTVACDNMGVTYDKAVIVEDAVSGVQAGRNGRFGLTLGIAKEENRDELKANGADIVVEDMSEITLDDIQEWFKKGIEDDMWQISYVVYNKEKERTRETLCAVGNGYLGTRGSAEECKSNKVNYPATYIAGVYNRLSSEVAGRTIYNEDFVNAPNWTHINFKIGDGEWFDYNAADIINFEKKLNFKTGEFSRKYIVKGEGGRETSIKSYRIASMKNPHLCAIKYKITPLNYSDSITVESSLDGNIKNEGVERYKELNCAHLSPVSQSAEKNVSRLLVETTQSKIKIAESAVLFVTKNSETINPPIENDILAGAVSSSFTLDLKQNDTLCVDKIVSIHTSNDAGIDDAMLSSGKSLENQKSYDGIYKESAAKWADLWKEIDVKITGDRFAQKLIRMHLFHILATSSPHNSDIDAGIPARGLNGEAYRGHIFWDELFILPLYNAHFPEVSKANLMYRYRRLDAARKYAKEHGYRGSMFPWQSGSTGEEETQVVHLNPLTGEWGDDYSSFQRHVSLAVAANIWEYYNSTGDMDFMRDYGAEMLFEICRFVESKSVLNEATGRYEIKNVMGPDEYHEHHSNCPGGGLKDNSYTNIMAAWALERAFDVLDALGEDAKNSVMKKINLLAAELDRWEKIRRGLNLVIKDGVLAQFDGYFELKELDWDSYRAKYGNIHRMDRILKSEGKTPDDYKIAKQADTLMAFYNLDTETIKNIMAGLGYDAGDDFLRKNYDYYIQRTSHGSTLSKIAHAALSAYMGEQKQSWDLYMDALQSDYTDVQGGTTGEGIHTGAMAGTVLLAMNIYAGVDFRGRILKINPALPEHWGSISFKASFKGDRYSFVIKRNSVDLTIESANPEIAVIAGGKQLTLSANKRHMIKI